MKKSMQKADQREYTFKIIPHQGETVRSFRLPMRTIRYGIAAVCVGVVLFTGAFAYSAYHASLVQREKAELEELRQVNALQQSQILQLSKKASAMQEDLNQLSALENEIRQLAVADGSEVSRAGLQRGVHEGQGGPGIAPNMQNLNEALNEMGENVQARKASLESLKVALENKRAKMAVTPSIWPAAGDVSSRYGLRWSGSDFHPGIDIANDVGTPVMATADGTVIDSGWNAGGYGYMVDIDHGNGIVTRYAHNSEVAVQTGAQVKKGQVIAYMGSTGFSTGPHVHYEVLVNGKAVNPDRFL